MQFLVVDLLPNRGAVLVSGDTDCCNFFFWDIVLSRIVSVRETMIVAFSLRVLKIPRRYGFGATAPPTRL